MNSINNNNNNNNIVEGWLNKQGGRFSNNFHDILPIGIVYLSQTSIDVDTEQLMLILTAISTKRLYAFKVNSVESRFENTNHHSFKIVCDTKQDLEKWVSAISQSVKSNDISKL
ncbi:hypothetical protein DFA_06577 [Cavenderia fasciculata]|uniref:PH domain-containing protein n=1 Tax=Cavenderia fasciculata TaxID=261658 RepID=F4PJE1_CACFS|nr:uncharacterized protein DFA_06577 [Cavenderia fasciculata]EGG24427.1 hypothetical protein DFA_06577 [Cavenderia fasciculata]|eukprot:XP_004362278.1 hypothetical protein DFA_06577 [Cavenderia fasciculata]